MTTYVKWMMSVYVGVIVLLGFVLLYYALFYNPHLDTKQKTVRNIVKWMTIFLTVFFVLSNI
ncbi:hypothetical protein [Staphylococcus succinus]|uniref:hypothetical protein n=1 Tax=Staphylococcus succinus TaxID=61015 RepID=UPI00115E60F3|nr:hypothetical protein [Staphylococcus succinus]